MTKEDYFKYYIQGSDHYLIPKDVFDELFEEMSNWREEAKELKKQLEKCYCNRTDCSGRIKGSKTCDSLEQKIKTQQKDFISYLENEKNRLIHEVSHYYTDSFDRQHVVNEDVYDEVDKILNKFKEIIGNDINVGSNGGKDER